MARTRKFRLKVGCRMAGHGFLWILLLGRMQRASSMKQDSQSSYKGSSIRRGDVRMLREKYAWPQILVWHDYMGKAN